MKNIILLILLSLAFTSYGQTQTGGIFLRVNDSTTYRSSASTVALHTAGYHDIVWNNQATTKHYDIYFGPGTNDYYHVKTLTWAGGGGGGSVTSVSGTSNRITSTGGTTPVIDISATFEALLGKVAQRIDQNNASTTSAQLATTISDETGTGVLVYGTSPTFTTGITTPLIKITSGSPGANKVLTSDADGDATWVDSGVISGTSIAGTYTPTLTNSANISASTTHIFNYSRVGNTVTVSGYVTIDPTTTATLTTMGISLPPNALSNFSDVQEAGGTAAAIGVADAPAGIMADATNDRLTLQYVCTDVTNHSMFLTATYQVR